MTFDDSAAGSLVQALRAVGRGAERVIPLGDDLSIGPLAGAAARDRWRERLPRSDERWRAVLAASSDPVVWMCRRSARERCGFLELVRRRRAPPRVVDITDVPFTDRQGAPFAPWAFSVVGSEMIVSEALFDKVRRLTGREVARLRRHWARLRREDAPLRIISRGRLISAPITRFDAAIAEAIPATWTAGRSAFGAAVSRMIGIHDTFVFARIEALVEAGALAARGAFPDLEESELRRT